MARTRYAPLRKAGGARKRRRTTSTTTKARYLPKTASANRSLIKSNARLLGRIRAQLPPAVHCDFEQRNSIVCFPGTNLPAATPTTFVTNGRALTNFADWTPCLRQSQVVNNKSSTTVYRMQMQIRYTLQQSYWAQISLFIVTLRRDAANREPTGTQILQEGIDYVSNRVGVSDDPLLQQNPVLNSSIYKVHYARHVTMTQGGYLESPANIGGNDVVANGQTTYRKGQVNIRMRLKVRNPRADIPWNQIPIAQLPHYNQYFLLTFCNQSAAAEATIADLAIIDTHMVCSTRNSG